MIGLGGGPWVQSADPAAAPELPRSGDPPGGFPNGAPPGGPYVTGVVGIRKKGGGGFLNGGAFSTTGSCVIGGAGPGAVLNSIVPGGSASGFGFGVDDTKATCSSKEDAPLSDVTPAMERAYGASSACVP